MQRMGSSTRWPLSIEWLVGLIHNIKKSFDRIVSTLHWSEKVLVYCKCRTLKHIYLKNTEIQKPVLGQMHMTRVTTTITILHFRYVTAVRNTRYMGVRLADFVQFLSSVGVPPASLHVIGFSLGAEAAGFGGKELRRRGMLIGRITGKFS